MTTNEAAERLRFWGPHDDPEATDDFNLALREALAAERRATVERLRADGWTHEDIPLPIPRISVERLQRAMKEAHGRRISTTETYAEAIARRYNAILDEEAAR